MNLLETISLSDRKRSDWVQPEQLWKTEENPIVPLENEGKHQGKPDRCWRFMQPEERVDPHLKGSRAELNRG